MNNDSLCSQINEAVNNGAQLVDVRSPAEYASGSIKGAINVPYNNIQNQAQQLDPNKPVLLYCVSGMRAQMAQQTLSSLGFSNAFNIGGYNSIQHC